MILAPVPDGVKRLALIGAGPSNLFLAGNLLKKRSDIHIDMYERNAQPFGLVRYGIAGDHTALRKGTYKKFDEILSNPMIRLIANTEVDGDAIASHTSNDDKNHIQLRQLVDPSVSPYILTVIGTGGRMEAVKLKDMICTEPWQSMKLVGLDTWGLDLIGDPLGLDGGVPCTMLLEAETLIGLINQHPNVVSSCPDLLNKINAAVHGNNIAIIGGGNVAIDILRFFVGDRDAFDKDVIHKDAQDYMQPRRIHVLIRSDWWNMKATNSELSDFMKLKALGVSYEVRGFYNHEGELNRSQKRLRNIFQQLIEKDDDYKVEGGVEVVFHFRSQAEQIDIYNNRVSLSDEDTISNVRLIVGATGFKVKEPPETAMCPSLPLENIGWLSTNGRGSLADSSNNANWVYQNIVKLIEKSSNEHSGRVLFTDKH